MGSSAVTVPKGLQLVCFNSAVEGSSPPGTLLLGFASLWSLFLLTRRKGGVLEPVE